MKNDDNEDKREDLDEENQDEPCGSDESVVGHQVEKTKNQGIHAKGVSSSAVSKFPLKRTALCVMGVMHGFTQSVRRCPTRNSRHYQSLTFCGFAWIVSQSSC